MARPFSHPPHSPASASRPPSSPLPTTHSQRPHQKPLSRSALSTCQIVIAERCRTMVEKSRRQHLEGFYAAIGEKASVHPQRVTLMPQDPRAFAVAIFQSLGGRPFHRQAVVGSSAE